MSSAPRIQLSVLRKVLNLRCISRLLLFISTLNLHTICLEGFDLETVPDTAGVSPFVPSSATPRQSVMGYPTKGRKSE